MAVPSIDRFDEIRRAWIAAHQGISTISGAALRYSDVASGRGNPPCPTRTTIQVSRRCGCEPRKSPTSQVESFAMTVVGLVVPLGWAGGYLLSKVVAALIPIHLRAFPVAALLWSGAPPSANHLYLRLRTDIR